jgi:hypothetical protein
VSVRYHIRNNWCGTGSALSGSAHHTQSWCQYSGVECASLEITDPAQ